MARICCVGSQESARQGQSFLLLLGLVGHAVLQLTWGGAVISGKLTAGFILEHLVDFMKLTRASNQRLEQILLPEVYGTMNRDFRVAIN